jgi:TolA-binding protein
MALPSKAQIVGASKGSGDMHNTLILLRDQLSEHIVQIANLQSQLAALQKKVK